MSRNKRNINTPMVGNNIPKVINFAKQYIPINTEIKTYTDNHIVPWGQSEINQNLYPQFLVNLYNNHPLHKSIVDKKKQFVMGKGAFNKDKKKLSYMVNDNDTIDMFLNKVISDYVLIGSFAIEVIYNRNGKPFQLRHIPIEKVRINNSKNIFWITDDWTNHYNNTLSYYGYGYKDHDDLGINKVFYQKNYSTSINQIYPVPEYSGGIQSIVCSNILLDMIEGDLSNDFALNTILTLYGGNFTQDQKRNFEHQFNNNFVGANRKKYVIDYQPLEGGKPMEVQTVQNVDNSDTINAYREELKERIYQAHNITSPLLFGDKTDGSFNSNDLDSAYQIFINTYVDDIRNELYNSLKNLFSDCGFEMFELYTKELVKEQLDATVKAQVMTIDELRAIQNLPPLPNGEGNKLLANFQQQQPVQQSQVVLTDVSKKKDDGVIDLTNATQEEVKEVINKEQIEAIEQDKKVTDEELLSHFEKVGVELSPNEYDFIAISDDDFKKHYGGELTDEHFGRYTNEHFSIWDDIRKLLGIPKKEDKKIGEGTANEKVVTVMYKYELRPNVPAAKSGSRPFCKRMMELNRFYDRADIQQIAANVKRDVFLLTGGYYHNPVTGITTNYCRHKWTAYRVIKK